MLKEAVAVAIDPDHEIDNPVTFSRGKIEVSENATPAERLYIDQLDIMNSRLENLEMFQEIMSGGAVTRRMEWPNKMAIPDSLMVKIAISARNTAPDADLESAIMPIISQIPGAIFRPTGRTHGIAYFPKVENPDKIQKYIRDRLSEDFMVSMK